MRVKKSLMHVTKLCSKWISIGWWSWWCVYIL